MAIFYSLAHSMFRFRMNSKQLVCNLSPTATKKKLKTKLRKIQLCVHKYEYNCNTVDWHFINQSAATKCKPNQKKKIVLIFTHFGMQNNHKLRVQIYFGENVA